MKTCDKLTALIMDYWNKCVSKGFKADYEVNKLVDDFAEFCGVYEKNFDYDVTVTVNFLTNSQKRKLYKMLLNSRIK